jgi:hypothetical protein
MSYSNVDAIMERIKIATKQSPIAVFTGSRGLNAVFGATIDTLTKINYEPENYVGMFYGEMDQAEVRDILEKIK